MNADTLPAGYVLVCGDLAVHVAEVRQYTTDIRRFLELLPVVEKLSSIPLGSEEWRRFVETLTVDHEALQTTMREVARLQNAVADRLATRKLDA